MNVLDFYTDIDMKTPVLSPPVGVASLTGTAADLTTWGSIGQYTYDTGFYRKIYRKNINASSGIVLGGTGAIATIFSPYNWVTGATPKMADGAFRNAFFINVHNIGTELAPNYRGIYLQIDGTQFQDSDGYWHFNPYIRIGNYRADPSNVITDKQERTNHKYYTGTDYEFAAEVSASWSSTSQYNQIAMYSCVVNETDYFLFVLGVNNGALHPSNTVPAVLIPRSYFKYNIPKPYVGPVSKESAESAYVGNEAGTDSISSRDLSSLQNPFGFNSGGTMYLSEITASTYHSIVSGIYDGTSGSPLNALGQVVSGIVGGNTHRPAEEIDAMIKGVLCCQIVPTITTYTTGSPVAIYTISGYQLQNTALAGNAVNQICTAETAAFAVKRINGSFLDFEPYTTIDLVIPFLGTVRIPASVLIDKAVKIRFAIDLLSGTLSADIIIVETGRTWVYTTLQGNCALDMPIMGAGANANPLLKIASAAGGIATGGTLGAAAGVFNIIDGASSAAFSQPVGKCNLANIGAFLSPRDIALIIHTPSPSNAQDFGVIVGTPSNMSGKVGDFSGYTEFADIDLSSVVGATDSELSEIETVLKGGCFV